MNRSDIIQGVVMQAAHSGWTYRGEVVREAHPLLHRPNYKVDLVTADAELQTVSLNDIIFDPLFAKALWDDVWKERFVLLVLADDRINYLGGES